MKEPKQVAEMFDLGATEEWTPMWYPEVEVAPFDDGGDRYFVARLKDHPSIMSDGETREEAFANLLGAMVSVIEALGAWLAEKEAALKSLRASPNSTGENP